MFQVTVVALLVALSWSSAGADDDWAAYKTKYNKIYTGDEDISRRANWEYNKIQVKKHNELYDQGKTSFSVQENMFSDKNLGDIQSVNDVEAPVSEMLVSRSNKLPDSVDWRKKGFVTEVKHQANFTTCWAFAVVAAVESHHLKSTGNYVLLSESNLIDCVKFNSCSSFSGPFQYIIDNNGIATAASYPYNPPRRRCKFSSSMVGAQIKSYVALQSGNETALMEAVATKGPVAVGIDSNHSSFKHYLGGLYYEPYCSKNNLDHAVLVVGYGTLDGKDYWLLKNSWGTAKWGEKGYMKMSRNKNNMCGIASIGMYPVVGGISGQDRLTHCYMFVYLFMLHKLYF